MKKRILPLLALLVFAGFQSCITGSDPTDSVTNYTPILMDRSELDNSIKILDPKPLKKTGKIYRYQHWLFINEKFEGLHVYNNQDPSNPEAIAFLKIPGNIDLAIKDDVMYVDNAVDLVALDFSTDQVNILSRSKDVFPELVPPDFGDVPDEFLPENRPANTVIIKWEEQ